MPEGPLFGIQGHQLFRRLEFSLALVDEDQIVLLQGHKIQVRGTLSDVLFELRRPGGVMLNQILNVSHPLLHRLIIHLLQRQPAQVRLAGVVDRAGVKLGDQRR